MRQSPLDVLVGPRLDAISEKLESILDGQAKSHDNESLILDEVIRNRQIFLSKLDEQFLLLIQSLHQEARDGPRLFTLEPVERETWNPARWVKARFRITLWCEHSRLPLPVLNRPVVLASHVPSTAGVYEFDITREWLEKAAPTVKLIASVLSPLLPVAAAALKVTLGDASYKPMASQVDLQKEGIKAMLDVAGKASDWLAQREGLGLDSGDAIRAEGGVLRQFQAWLSAEDPSFGGLRKVTKKNGEVLWVHQDYVKEY